MPAAIARSGKELGAMPMTKPASATSPTVSQVSAVTFCSNGSSSGMRAMNPITNGRLHLSRHFLSRDWPTDETHVETTAGEKKGGDHRRPRVYTVVRTRRSVRGSNPMNVAALRGKTCRKVYVRHSG